MSAAARTTPDIALPRVLVAGIGNVFLRDDGFGAEVARRMHARTLREGVYVFEFGTGGLDLVHELMRGYDALILVDVSRRGEAPGTLYVIEPSPADVHAGEGAAMDPHAVDPETVLRYVKSVSGWPSKVFIIACEPAEIGDVGRGSSAVVERSVEGAIELVADAIAELDLGARRGG